MADEQMVTIPKRVLEQLVSLSSKMLTNLTVLGQCPIEEYEVVQEALLGLRAAEALRVSKPEQCPEGGVHEYSPDLEYDPSGQTINCEKCGESVS